MAQTASGLTADQVMQADQDRTKRIFIGFLSSALGVDQTYSNDDLVPDQQPGQYIVANPDGTYSAQGKSQSNMQTPNSAVSGLVLTPTLIILAIAGYFLLKKL